MSSGPMRGRMIEAKFEGDTLTFEMERGYYAAAGKYVIFRESDYFSADEQMTELLEALRKIEATGNGSTDGGNHYVCQSIAAEAIANATQQRNATGGEK